MPESTWHFGTRSGHVIRWQGPGRPSEHKRPFKLEVLTPRGWTLLGPVMARLLWRRARPSERAFVRRRLLRSYSPVGPDDERIDDSRSRLRVFWLVWLLSPPLQWGAPRFLPRGGDTDATAAADSFRASLTRSPCVDQPLVDQARNGWQTARDRRTGFESRAGTFVQVAGLTTTVVLVNSTLLSGKTALTGTWRAVFEAAVLTASACLLAAGAYGLFATMRTFDSVAPDVVHRIIARARMAEEENRRREQVAALLLAQRRTSIVADWKLARLKRASFWFGAAIVAIAVASASFVIAVERHHPDTTTKTTSTSDR